MNRRTHYDKQSNPIPAPNYFLGPSTLLSTIFRVSAKACSGVGNGGVVASQRPVLVVYRGNETGPARQIETVEMVGLGLEDHWLVLPCPAANLQEWNTSKPHWTNVHFKNLAVLASIIAELKNGGMRYGRGYARRDAGVGCHHSGVYRAPRRHICHRTSRKPAGALIGLPEGKPSNL